MANVHLLVNRLLGAELLLDFLVHSHSEVEDLFHSLGESVFLDDIEVVR